MWLQIKCCIDMCFSFLLIAPVLILFDQTLYIGEFGTFLVEQVINVSVWQAIKNEQHFNKCSNNVASNCVYAHVCTYRLICANSRELWAKHDGCEDSKEKTFKDENDQKHCGGRGWKCRTYWKRQKTTKMFSHHLFS